MSTSTIPERAVHSPGTGNLITAVAMPRTGFVSSRIGDRTTLPAGPALVVIFAGRAAALRTRRAGRRPARQGN